MKSINNLSKRFTECKTLQDYLAMREEIKTILQQEEYGFFPEPPLSMMSNILLVEVTMAGKAFFELIKITLKFKGGKTFSFPFKLCYRKGQKSKTILLLNFRDDFPDKYLPAEEIFDKGWNIATVCFNDITKDNGDFNDGLAQMFDLSSENSAGKIILWSYAAMRIADYLSTRAEVDRNILGVAGHSRLGKAALVTAGFDERFSFCHSNCSGTCGAALFSMKNEKSESIEFIVNTFPHWFCKSFYKYAGKEKEMPFDQNLLISLIAPRVVSIGSAEDDLWANPEAEYKALKSASKVWRFYGLKQMSNVTNPKKSKVYGKSATYYIRAGSHYLSRDDWNLFLKTFDANSTDT